MTVAIGLVCSDGVLLASDSMSTSGQIAARSKKVQRFKSLPVAWTASGSVYVIEEVAIALTQVENAILGDPAILTQFKAPNLEVIRQSLVNNIKQVMHNCYSSALPFGLNQSQNGRHPFITDFLITGFVNNTPYLLEVANDGQVNWHTDEGFYAIGSGGEFATVAQALMTHYREEGPLPLSYGMQLAYRAIETTCEVSNAFVGLPVQLAVVDANGPREVNADEVEKLKTAVAGWKQLEREVFMRQVVPPPSGALEVPPSLAPTSSEPS